MTAHPLPAIIAMMATSLGDVTAREVVEREASLAGFGAVLTEEETITLLKRIEAGGGPPGLAARLVRVRLQRASHSDSSSYFASSTPIRRFDVKEIVAMFSPALGVDKANTVVRNGLAAMNITNQSISRDDALALVEQLSRQGGVVATIARFVKARLMLQGTSSG